MSRKEQRFVKKCVAFDELLYKMEVLAQEKEKLEEQVKLIDESIHEMDHMQADIVQNLRDRNCNINIEYMSLFDGSEEFLVYIMAYKNAMVMYCNGVYAEAKCHPQDEYNPMLGYALCRNRLIEKLLKLKYNI